MIKVVRLANLTLAVVVDDGIWQIFKFNSRRPQRWTTAIEFKILSKAGVADAGH